MNQVSLVLVGILALAALVSADGGSSTRGNEGIGHFPLQPRVKRGAAYAGGHGDFSGVAKMSTFASLGAYGGAAGYGSKGSTAGGYGAGSGGLNSAGGISISGALGSYGGYLGHHGPTVISSGGYGNGGLLFGKI